MQRARRRGLLCIKTCRNGAHAGASSCTAYINTCYILPAPLQAVTMGCPCPYWVVYNYRRKDCFSSRELGRNLEFDSSRCAFIIMRTLHLSLAYIFGPKRILGDPFLHLTSRMCHCRVECHSGGRHRRLVFPEAVGSQRPAERPRSCQCYCITALPLSPKGFDRSHAKFSCVAYQRVASGSFPPSLLKPARKQPQFTAGFTDSHAA